MRAARLYEPGQLLRIEDVPVPKTPPDGVRVRIAGSGVCHSDLHIIRGHMAMPLSLPLTLGHENAGYVEEVGAGVTGFEPGDAVAVFGGWGCGTCSFCRGGEEQLCDVMKWVGIGRDGGYAEFLLVPNQRHLVKLEGLDPVDAAPLTDAGLTPYRAVKKVAPHLPPGSWAVTIGVGGLGQFGLQFLKVLTAAQVVAVDIDDDKLALAAELGADATLNARQDVGAEVKRITGGEGAQAVLDFVGNDATLQAALAAAGRGCRIVVVGLGGGTFPYSFMGVPSELKVTNSVWGSRRDLEEVLALGRQGKVKA